MDAFQASVEFILIEAEEFQGNIDDAAGVDHVVGGVEDAALHEFFAVPFPCQLVVGGAGNDRGAQLRQRLVVYRSAERTG